MMDTSPKPPEALLRAIAGDLKPVKPSPRPLPLVLRMVPFALLVSSLVLLALGPRQDARILGPLLTWGASAAQLVLAMAMVWMAAHESHPAGRLPEQTVYLATATATLVVVFITLLTYWTDPASGTLHITAVIDEKLRLFPWIASVVCGVGSTIAGGILVLLFSLLFRHSLAARPARAGALYGAGAGLAVNAGWRAACPVSTLWHALGAHGAAIVATVLLGALIGRWLGNRRLYPGRDSRTRA